MNLVMSILQKEREDMEMVQTSLEVLLAAFSRSEFTNPNEVCPFIMEFALII